MALIGILILLLIKLVIYMNDLKDFRKFENEKKKAKWAEVRVFISVLFSINNQLIKNLKV